MQDILSLIRTTAHDMWRYRWLGAAVAWAATLISVAAVYQVQDRYQASARIYVDTQSVLKPLMAGLAVQPNVTEQVAMLGRTVISRPNIEKLAGMAGFDLSEGTEGQRQAAVDGLMRELKITSAGRDNLFNITFHDSDPERAKRAISSLVTIFVESGIGTRQKQSDSAKAFIEEQIESYRAKLEEAESRLKQFRLRNIDVRMTEGADFATRLSELSRQLEDARLQLREAEQSRDSAKAQLDAEKNSGRIDKLPDLVAGAPAVQVATPEIDARIDAQKRSLDALLGRFTESHPDVVSTKRIIRDLEEQRSREVAEKRKQLASQPQPVARPDANLAMQELHRVYATAEVNVAALKARVAEYGSRYAQARAALRTAPQVEAEAAQLNRDYAIHKKNYEDLVARRESAAITGDLDMASGVAEFRLIDPPFVSPHPVFPNRQALFPLALLAGIAAGLLAAFAATTMRPVFHQVSDLRSFLQLPVLGMVSYVSGEAAQHRRRVEIGQFAAASVGLMVVYSVLVAAVQLLGGH
jgi:polysaccharide chain length determinant protein (PEP-CTERM system associated)